MRSVSKTSEEVVKQLGLGAIISIIRMTCRCSKREG
jgi:hypothetical protein